MNKGLKCYYLRGWIHPESMDDPQWLPTWQATAKTMLDNGKQLVVFELPNNPDGGRTIEEIERLLQQKFGTPVIKT